MPILGLDIGDKRIGIAISDKTGLIAQGLMTLERLNIEHDLSIIEDIIKSKDIDLIVIGLPLNMNGTLSKEASKVLEFKKILSSKTNLKIITYDERLSSKEAEDLLIRANISRKKRRPQIDKIAAQIILQKYLDSFHTRGSFGM